MIYIQVRNGKVAALLETWAITVVQGLFMLAAVVEQDIVWSLITAAMFMLSVAGLVVHYEGRSLVVESFDDLRKEIDAFEERFNDTA